MPAQSPIPLSPALNEMLLDFTGGPVAAAIILGSGLGGFAEALDIEKQVPTSDLPGYPASTVAGHEGRLLLASMNGRKLLLFKGRVHGYEGYSGAETSLTALLAAAAGTPVLIMTNAAGGLHPAMSAGDLMLLTDALVMPQAPLMGRGLHGAPGSLPPLPRPLFSDRMLDLARLAAADSAVLLREGTYAFCSGPTYESRAEIAFFRQAGADAAGMSTVPEIVTAVRCGMEVLGISCITNKALTVPQKVTHEEVTAVAAAVSERLTRLILAIVARL